MNDWINSPLLKDIDPVKLELIKMAASQTSGKSGKRSCPSHACPDHQRK